MVAIPGPQNNLEDLDLMRVTGGFIAGFSLVMGLLFLFVLPVACNFLGSLGVLGAGLFFIIGLLLFGLGHLKLRKKRRQSIR